MREFRRITSCCKHLKTIDIRINNYLLTVYHSLWLVVSYGSFYKGLKRFLDLKERKDHEKLGSFR